MEKHKNLKVIIAGKDRRAYSYDAQTKAELEKLADGETRCIRRKRKNSIHRTQLSHYRELLWRRIALLFYKAICYELESI